MAETPTLQEQMATRLAAVHQGIALAATRAGRPATAVTLIAVSKTMDAATVRAAALAGIGDLGENKVQEAAAKIAELSDVSLRWHLIGHLQRNKAKRAAELFDMIHTIDSLELATALSHHAAGRARPLQVLAQVNVSGEATKEGFDPRTLRDEAAALAALPHLQWRGLMTIAPATDDEAPLRAVFAATRRLQEELAAGFGDGWDALSMGMTNDYPLAIAEGATHVRVGRAIFGERTVAGQG
jgi:pyridoxal phosphate enzyme (YggS family)